VRPARADLLIGLAGATAGAVVAVGEPPADIVTAAVLGASLGGARRWPRATWMLATAIILTAAVRGELPGGTPFAGYLLVAAHAIVAARYDRTWDGAAGPLALLGASLVSGVATSDSGPFLAFVCVASWAAGRAWREHEEVAARLAERARELEEEREAHAELSVRYERARIASELHDIVAHAISVMVVQATAGQRLAAYDPDLTAETFANIAGAARQAESDLGRLVALLGDDDAIGDAPDLSLVEELVSRAAGSGLDVSLRLEGNREGLPAPLTEVAYRVVQEGLTNALRYSAGAAVRVVVTGSTDGLDVSVENDPAESEAALEGAGTGNGLRGLRERVGACAGTVEAGPTPDGGWRLHAQLPRRATATAS
jgi:signal transduction histidine kinase